MDVNQLLKTYYEGFARKAGWEETISEDFRFIGGDMTHTDPVTGRQAYQEVINRFSRLFTSMKVVETFVNGNTAFVLANYDFVFPGGLKINGNVAEHWIVKNGKLDQLTIYFDTLTFQKLTQPQQ